MAESSGISWTDATFNPWRGCAKISPACTNCYADTLSQRNPSVLGVWGTENAGGTRVAAAESYWREPLKWDRAAEAEGVRRRVFCASLADVFEDWRGPVLTAKGKQLWAAPNRAFPAGDVWVDGPLPGVESMAAITLDDLRRRLFRLIKSTPNLDWLVLTKRPENFRAMLPPDWGEGGYRNVWLGVTVENQQYADERIPLLLATPAAVRFISAEPLVAAVDLLRADPLDLGHGVTAVRNFLFGGVWRKEGRAERWVQAETGPSLDWVITGGESGAGARPGHPDWYRSLRDQCQAAGVPFHFKQHGEWLPLDHQDHADPTERQEIVFPDGRLYDGKSLLVPPFAQVSRVGKKAAGRLLDGVEWAEFPEV